MPEKRRLNSGRALKSNNGVKVSSLGGNVLPGNSEDAANLQ